MPRLPPLNALRCLEAAVRARSFTRAADELNVTQSAVSHQIRQLEAWFGISLFQRLGRETEPTERALEFGQALSEAFGIIATACRRASQRETGPVLTIAVIPSIATIWLIPRLSQFMTQHPGIAIKVVYAFHGAPIDFSETGIAILWGKEPFPTGRVTRFLDGATYPVCSASFLEKYGPFRELSDIARVPVLHDTDEQGWQTWFHAAGLKSQPIPHGPFFADFNLLRAATLAGQGAALCPASLIADDVGSGRLAILFKTPIHQDLAYHILEPEDPDPAQANTVATFKAWLLGTAR